MRLMQRKSEGGKILAVLFLLLSCVPLFGQYYSNDVTPPGLNSGKLTGASSGKQVGGGSNGHAYLINGNSLNSVDLHPAGWTNSMARSSDATQQCGYGYSPITGGNHALLWSGSAASYVDLHNSFTWTYCAGIDNGQQVGFGETPVYFTTYQKAMMWTGSAASAVVLHPLAYGYSKALAVRNGQQVGYGSSLPYPTFTDDSLGYHTTSHALLWTGSAASVVDLNPLGYDASEALATNGVQQGGWAYSAISATHQHAGVWSGTADTFVDLHPTGYSDTKITGMTLTKQVGEGWVGAAGQPGSVRHALVWQGTADSVVDLNQYLPAGYIHGVATGVDADGNVVGYAYNTPPSGTAMPVDAIAVVFAPGQVPPASLLSISLNSSNVAPGANVQVSLTLSSPAPAGGLTISFLSTNTVLLPTPASITVAEGQSSATFSLVAGGATLQVPTSFKLYANDGRQSKFANLTITPVVNLSSVTVNAVEGGFNTFGALALSIPAQAGGATISLTSSNPVLATVPASITIPQGLAQSSSFTIPTTPVSVATAVTITAVFNGQTATATLNLSPAPVVSVASVSIPPIVGGQSAIGTVTLNNFPRGIEGAVVSLVSGDAKTLQVPDTITVPQYAYSVTFPITTVVVPGQKGVSVKATYNGSNITTTVSVAPIPTITITQADYLTDTHMFKVQVTTALADSVLTYGTDPLSPPIGTMQFELGVFKGSMILATAPAYATVWSSYGGMVTVPVTQKLSSAATGGGGGGGGSATGGGGGGGGSTATTFKLTTSKNGKGTVTVSPVAASYAAGTVVTLTATPDPGSPWVGWGGACSGTQPTCTVTMNANLSVVANFK